MNDLMKKMSGAVRTGFFLLIVSVLFAGCASSNKMVQQTGLDHKTGSERKVIKDVNIIEDDESIVVSVTGNKMLAYTASKETCPLSVVLYLPNTNVGNIQKVYNADNDVIDSIELSELPGNGNTTAMITIALAKDVSYHVNDKETRIEISFSKTDELSNSVAEAKQESVEKKKQENPDGNYDVSALTGKADEAAKNAKKEIDTKNLAQKISNAEKIKPAWVNRVDFSGEDAGKSTIIIGTTEKIDYKVVKFADKMLHIKLYNTNIKPYRKRQLITTRFESAVNRITPVQTPAMEKYSIVAVELRETVPYYIEQSDNMLFVHFDASSIPPKPLEEAGLPEWEKVLDETLHAVKGNNQAVIAAGAAAQVSSSKEKSTNSSGSGQKIEIEDDSFLSTGESGSLVTSRNKSADFYDLDRQMNFDPYTGKKKQLNFYRTDQQKKYTGEKVALDFYETDVKNVFRILREISGKNFAIDKDVTGKVTLTFENPVPWDQVLDLVLKMNRLSKVYEGDIIRIATLKTLENEERDRKNKLKAKQDADLQEDLVTAFIPIKYAKASDIKCLIKVEGRGAISVDDRSNMIILTAAPVAIKRAKEIIERIDMATPQVLIEARVVEVTKDFSRAIGTQWGAIGGPLNDQLGNIGGDMDYNLAFNHAVASTSTVGIDFTRLTGTNLLLNAQLTAQQTEGTAKIISSPKVLTLDNEKATIKQGKEIPYLERDDSGGSSVKFKKIFLELEVTPHITPDKTIAMEIKVTKNDLGSIIEGIPTITIKEVETMLLVNDGDTIVIGGIMQSSVNEGSSSTPWLSEIPVLGWLFKSKTDIKNQIELLIFLTPKLVLL